MSIEVEDENEGQEEQSEKKPEVMSSEIDPETGEEKTSFYTPPSLDSSIPAASSDQNAKILEETPKISM